MKKLMKLVSSLTAASLLLSQVACQGSKAQKEEKQNGQETQQESANATGYKDTLNIAITAQPPTLDPPITSSNITIVIGGNIFEQLFSLDKDYNPAPELAESVSVSEDGLIYTIPIKKGIKFHNGKEMTADDVVSSMNRWLITSSKAKVLLAGANFEKVDDYTVKLTVASPTSDVMIALASRSQFPAIYPKEIVEAADEKGVKEYIGTGPYKLQEWKQDQYISLVKNEEYQQIGEEVSGFTGKKEAATENIFFYFIQDPSTRLAGLQTGEYDVAEEIPLENYETINNNPDLVLHTKEAGTLNMFMNTQEGTLANEKIRQAILAALDNKEIMLGSYTSEENFVLNPGYMDPKQAQWAVDSGKELYNQANPEKAKQLLAEAGYNGEKVVLLTTKDYQEMYNATLVIQDQLKKIGINAEVANFDFPTFMSTKDDRSQWDIFVTSNSYNLLPQQILAVNPDWAGFNHENVANYLNVLRTAKSPEEAKEQWGKLQEFMYTYASSSVIGHYKDLCVTSNNVEGFEYFIQPVYWNVKVKN